MDPAFLEVESELTIKVFLILFQVLSHANSLFNKMVQVLRDLWCNSFLLEDSLDFSTSKEPDLWDTVLVSQNNTDLALSESLFGEPDYKVYDV